jgi:hypothetical protein
VKKKKSSEVGRTSGKRKTLVHDISPIQKHMQKGITINNKKSNPASPTMGYRKSALNGKFRNLDSSPESISKTPVIKRKQNRQKTLINVQKRVEIYKGEFDDHNFVYNGMGSLTDRETFIYEGTFRMGKRHGFGFEFKILDDYDEKVFYRGEWENGLEDGCGFLVKSDKGIRIFQEGLFENGVFKHGKQIRIEEVDTNYYISELYLGVVSNNLYSGEGTLRRKYIKIPQYSERVEIEQEYEYEGQFVGGTENGKGTCRKRLFLLGYNYKYEGDFVDGQLHGNGSIEFEGEYYIKTYEGLFLNDKWCCFYGRVEFKSGDIYEGFFDKNHGKWNIGLYFHGDKGGPSDGKTNKADHFFGEYRNDKKHGLGKFLIKGHQLLIGKYDDGEKNGNFCLVQEEEEEVKLKNTFGINKNNLEKRAPDSLSLIRQIKTYYLFENDEGIDKSDKPFKD